MKSGFMIATPLIGTRLYDICKERGYLISEPDPKTLAIATQARGEGLIKTKDFDPQKLKELFSELDKKMTKIDLMEKISNPKYYYKSFLFIINHPVKSFNKFKNLFV